MYVYVYVYVCVYLCLCVRATDRQCDTTARHLNAYVRRESLLASVEARPTVAKLERLYVREIRNNNEKSDSTCVCTPHARRLHRRAVRLRSHSCRVDAEHIYSTVNSSAFLSCNAMICSVSALTKLDANRYRIEGSRRSSSAIDDIRIGTASLNRLHSHFRIYIYVIYLEKRKQDTKEEKNRTNPALIKPSDNSCRI